MNLQWNSVCNSYVLLSFWPVFSGYSLMQDLPISSPVTRFNPVVGGGPNGSVIHYSRNDQKVSIL